MTALETREQRSRRPSEAERPDRPGHGNTRGVGAAISRSLASKLGRPDGVGRVVHFLVADGCALIVGRVWALVGRGEM